MDPAPVVATPDLDFGIWFYVFLVFWWIVVVAVVAGFLRVVHRAWVASINSHPPVQRRDDFYGRHRGDRPASRAVEDEARNSRPDAR